MIKYIVQHRRGTIEQWREHNDTIIPREGEIVIELDEVNSLHKLKIGDGIHPYAQLKYLMAGDEIVTQVLARALPRAITVTLDVDKWTAITCKSDPNFGYYGQVIEIDDITEYSRLDLHPDAEMLAEFKDLDLVFTTENNRGIITVYSVGDKPLKTYTIQATIIETELQVEDDKIIGTPIGTPTVKSDWSQTDATKADYIKNKPAIPPVVSAVGMQYAISGSNTEISSAADWTVVDDSKLTQRQRACVFGNGYYVVCGLNGDVAYSVDAINWTEIAPFTSGTLTGITYGKGKFVAVAYETGDIWTAENTPDTWVQTGKFNTSIEAITYANNRFVAFGDLSSSENTGGMVYLSDDGKIWSEIETDFEFRAITYGDGKYVAAGTNGTIALSHDGSSWTSYSDINITNHYRAVAFGNGRFVVGGQGGLIRYSEDGETWTTATTNSTATISYIRAIQYAEGKFYAVMYTSNGGGEIWVSSNAAEWTVQYLSSTRLWCITEGNSTMVVSGDNGIIYTLNLGVVWHNYEPTITEGKYLWQRQYIRLSDGGIIFGEAKHILHSVDCATKEWVRAEIAELKESMENMVAELKELRAQIQSLMGNSEQT